MSNLLRCQNLTKSFGPRPLFQNVALAVSDGDRIGLIGPNGSGKSTLMKILAGLEHSDTDTGELIFRKGLRTCYVAQVDIFEPGSTPLSVVGDALRSAIEDTHERETDAAVLLGKIGFTDFDQPVDELSGGWRKRLAIARELARKPDLLLLDEPTNHLDLEGIQWLEELLNASSIGVVVVTHDRYFLEGATTRIIELSRAYPDGTFQIDGPYSDFLRRREEFLHAQAQQQVALSSKVREDIAWLQRGAKARRTKNKSRINDAAQRMRELSELKNRNAKAQATAVEFNATGRKTRNLLVATGIAKSFEDKPLFADLDLTLGPGDCLGLLGANGSGKTTLIKVLTGELTPDTGTIKSADNLRTVVFTQQRTELNRTQKLREALCPIGDTVFYQDRALHVTTWAKKFLFRTDQLNVPVGDLSGGEQARIIIANLMCKPADLLILDEPTNDLDIPSLEVLEQSLQEFSGSVLLVTHDRYMLERIATQVLGLDGKGNAKLFAAYSQWAAAKEEAAQHKEPAAKKQAVPPKPTSAKSKKLSYNEQREWDQMEENIHKAEARAEELEKQMSDPELIADHEKLQVHCRKLEAAQAEVATLYDRWAELEAKQQ